MLHLLPPHPCYTVLFSADDDTERHWLNKAWFSAQQIEEVGKVADKCEL